MLPTEQCRLAKDSEVELVSELVVRVFDQFVAGNSSAEGRADFHRYASPTALRARHLEGYLTFVVTRNERLVGVLHLKAGAHIAMLFVEGDSQRQGIGRKLISEAVGYAVTRQPPVPVMTLAATSNAVQAYQRLGFSIIGETKVIKGIRFTPMGLKLGGGLAMAAVSRTIPNSIMELSPL
jgi:GNAT superfamily N-acetyltransferase